MTYLFCTVWEVLMILAMKYYKERLTYLTRVGGIKCIFFTVNFSMPNLIFILHTEKFYSIIQILYMNIILKLLSN